MATFNARTFRVASIGHFVARIFNTQGLGVACSVLSFLGDFISRSISTTVTRDGLPILSLTASCHRFSGAILSCTGRGTTGLNFHFASLTVRGVSLPRRIRGLVSRRSNIKVTSGGVSHFIRCRATHTVHRTSGGSNNLTTLNTDFTFNERVTSAINRTSTGRRGGIRGLHRCGGLLSRNIVDRIRFARVGGGLLSLWEDSGW